MLLNQTIVNSQTQTSEYLAMYNNSPDLNACEATNII